MDVLNDLYENVGGQIRLKSREGEYEGIVAHVNKRIGRIKLNRTFLCPDRKFMGTLCFADYEIESYVVLSSKETNETELDRRYIATLNSYKRSTKKYTASHFNYSDSDCASQSVDEDENIEIIEEKYVFVPPERFQKLLPTDFIYVEDFDSEFVKVIDSIKKELVIGVSFEGPKIKRNGIVTWISISAPLYTFIFDINSLKSTCFDKGLRSIFEDPNIEKIIHDCRKPADCLLNMFNTKLVNVFDTQVADYMIRYKKHKNNRRYTRSLNSCLEEYLNIPKVFLYEPQVHNSFQSLVNSFNIRPITDNFKDLIMKNVVYLLTLKKELSVLLLASFHHAVRIYSSSVSSCSDMELLLEPSVPSKIPFQLKIEQLNMIRCRRKGIAPAVVSTGHQYQGLPSFRCVFRKVNEPMSSTLKETADLKERISNICFESVDVEKTIEEKGAIVTKEERKQSIASSGYQYQSLPLFRSAFCKVSESMSSTLKETADLKEPISNICFESADVEKNIKEKRAVMTKEEKKQSANVNDNETDDPWKKLREAFLPHCDLEHKKKYRIFPG